MQTIVFAWEVLIREPVQICPHALEQSIGGNHFGNKDTPPSPSARNGPASKKLRSGADYGIVDSSGHSARDTTRENLTVRSRTGSGNSGANVPSGSGNSEALDKTGRGIKITAENVPHTAEPGGNGFAEGFPDGTDDAFLSEFSQRFPLVSQLGSWRLLTPPDSVTSLATSILLGRYDTQICPETVIGKSGVGLPTTLANTLSSKTSRDPAKTWNEATCSWPLLCPSGKVSYSKLDKLRARRSRRPFVNAHGSWPIEDLQTLAARLKGNPI